MTNNGTETQAQDIYQEAFLATWRNVEMGRFQPKNANSIEGYLFRIVRNKWIDFLRSAKQNKTLPFKELTIAEEDNDERQEEDKLIDLVKEKFSELGESCRRLLTTFYYRQKPIKEIAAENNWTEATTRNNKYRCLQKLKELINQKSL